MAETTGQPRWFLYRLAGNVMIIVGWHINRDHTSDFNKTDSGLTDLSISVTGSLYGDRNFKDSLHCSAVF